MNEIEKLGSYISHLEAHRDSLIDRNEVLEAALREIAADQSSWRAANIARNALAPEQDR